MTHQGSFVESTKDKFEFARININVTYGIYARNISLIVETVIYFDSVFFNFQPPISYWTEFGGKSKKWNKIIDSLVNQVPRPLELR